TKFDSIENDTSWLNSGEITEKDGDGPPVAGFGAWACDRVPQASHAAAMTAPALLNKTIIRNSAGGPNRFFRPGRLARLGAADSLWRAAPGYIERGYRMKMSSVLRAALVAAIAFAGLSSARADEGFVTLTIYKAGWIIGGSGGSGVLQFRGRTYPLS